MVYDKLDRLVLTQDANQDIANQWTFTKYDALGRPVMTGFITDTRDRTGMQNAIDAWTGVMFVSTEPLNTENVLEANSISLSAHVSGTVTYRAKETIDFLPGFDAGTEQFDTEIVLALSSDYTFVQGYHDATFPSLKNYSFEVNTLNYYDNYDFTDDKDWNTGFSGFYSTQQEEDDFNFVTPSPDTHVKGLATGSRVRILGSTEFLTTVMYYDDKGRVIQTQADNHMAGVDISTTQYDFAGRVLHTHSVHNNPNSSANATTTILKRFTYDHVGRLKTISEKLNNGNMNTLVTNSYNELGELESKKLGDPTTPLETLDYDYNVRGWLKSINGDYVAGTASNHYFGMDLSYEHGFSKSQYNGNIAGVKWKSVSNTEVRAYGFDYDPVNRLTKADFTEYNTSWNNQVKDFSTNYSYEANGNIRSLKRESTIAGTKTTIDNLTYDYGLGLGLAGTGNQLLRVQDTAGDQGQGDFVDGNTSAVDYKYDYNGNMVWDKNKEIYLNNDNTKAITYNHLNLPETVSFGPNKTITYTYDAAGIKLSKQVNDNGSITTTDYVGGFIYENDELQHFAHEEGRVRKNNAGQLVHDYFVKDHLGNTRMTLTETPETTTYDATMEAANLNFEQQLFLNIPNPASTEEAFLGTGSAKLGPESIGPAKLLKVMAGDEVDLTVYAKYPSSFNTTQTGNTADIGVALASLFGATGGGASVYEQGTYTALNNNASGFLASAGSAGSNSTVPKAYLTYVFFDQDFNYVNTASGVVQIASDPMGNWNQISANDLIMPESGYLYVYLSNEGRPLDGGNVYFDELRIVHHGGHVLQEDHYYPFGANISALSSSAPLSTPNEFMYNGKELQSDFSLGLYDYGARFYDR